MAVGAAMMEGIGIDGELSVDGKAGAIDCCCGSDRGATITGGVPPPPAGASICCADAIPDPADASPAAVSQIANLMPAN
jgi:hypothetical protein